MVANKCPKELLYRAHYRYSHQPIRFLVNKLYLGAVNMRSSRANKPIKCDLNAKRSCIQTYLQKMIFARVAIHANERLCVCVCVRACVYVRACVRACVCVRAGL